MTSDGENKVEFEKEDHGLYSSVDPSYAVSRGLKILTTLFAWTRGVLIWSLWTPRVKKICLKKLGKIQIFVFLGTKMPISRALIGQNGRDFNTRTVGVWDKFYLIGPRRFGILWNNDFFKKRALGQPILAQIAQGSKWAILKQKRHVIRQIGGFRGRWVHFCGPFGCRMKFGIQSSGYIMVKMGGFWVTLKSSHYGLISVHYLGWK